MDYKFHPIADTFPLLGEKELAALAEDIKANGQRLPILADETDRIYDGRNRYLACLQAGVIPHITKTKGYPKITEINSLNIIRRHMSTLQIADTKRKIREKIDELKRLKNTLEHNQAHGRQDVDKKNGRADQVESVVIETQELKDVFEAQPHIREKTERQINKVRENGSKLLNKTLENGEISIEEAAEIAEKPKNIQKRKIENALKKKKEPKTIEKSDLLGEPINDRLGEVFAGAKLIDELTKLADELWEGVQEFAETETGAYMPQHMKPIDADISNIKAALKFCKPYAKCPMCGGDGCNGCNSVGWMPKEHYTRWEKQNGQD